MTPVVVAIDIGGTKIEIGLVDTQGRLIDRRSAATRALAQPEDAVAFIATVVAQWRMARSLDIQGVGIGCTGPVDPVTGRVGAVAFLPEWLDFPLAAEVGTALGAPVVLDNDAMAAAMAEWRWGAGAGVSRFVFVSVGTGIGTGVILDGQPYRGAGGAHPEFGHHTVDPTGPACYCGASGCWESLASGTAMAAWHAAVTMADPGEVSARQVFSEAAAGCEQAQATLDRTAYYLGLGLANLAAAFAPQRIAVGGGVAAGWSALKDRTLAVAESRGLTRIAPGTIERAMLGDEAALLGAAALWMNRPVADQEADQ